MKVPYAFETTSAALSPVFTYSRGVSINVEYAIRQSSSDIISVYLYNTHKDVELLLWQSSPYAIYGVLHSCITLSEDLGMLDVRIKVDFNHGDAMWKDENDGQTAVRKLMIDREACPGILYPFHSFFCIMSKTELELKAGLM